MSGLIDFVVPGIISVAKALLLLIVAFIVAAIVRKLVSALLRHILPESIKDKNPDFCRTIVGFTAKVSYLVTFLLFVPGIFGLLNMESASAPIILMLEQIVAFIPHIIVACIIVYIGIMLSKLCATIVERLVKSTKLDEAIIGIMPEEQKGLSISKYCGVLVELLLIIFFVVQGIDVLKLEVFDGIGEAIIGYIPYVLAAALIFIGCFCLDSFVGSVLTKGEHYGVAMLIKVVIYVVGVFMMLSQLGIASTIVNSAFVIIIAAIAVAFAIAFGIGGRDFASKILGRLDDSWRKDTHI